MKYTRASCFVYILLLLIPGAIAFSLWSAKAYHEHSVEKYKKSFEKIPNVERVSQFFDYEGTTFATMKLKNGKFISISVKSFDYSVFTKPDKLTLRAINEWMFFCRERRSDADGHGYINTPVNIIELTKSMNLKTNIHNIYDLVENIDSIDRYFHKFPVRSNEAKLGRRLISAQAQAY